MMLRLQFIGCCFAMDERENGEDRINLFPNPAGNELYVSVKNDVVRKVAIYSGTGALVREKEIGTISSYEDISDLIKDISAGLYIAIVDTEKGKYHKKLVHTVR